MAKRPVSAIMTRAPVQQVAPNSTVREACRIMAGRHIHSVLVMEEERLLGIFTTRDVLHRVLAPGHSPDDAKIRDFMTRDPDTIEPNEPIVEAIRRMDEFGYSHLPVVKDARVVGILSTRDFLIGDLQIIRSELETRKAVAERAW